MTLLGLAILLIPGVVRVWVDDQGHTWLSDREAAPSPEARPLAPEALSGAWQGAVAGEGAIGPSSSSARNDRYLRELAAASSDVQRGDVRQGLRRLRALWRERPERPEVPWQIARIERERGRLESARKAVAGILTGAVKPRWRARARRLDRELTRELEVAHAAGGPRQVEQSEHFVVHYDHAFAGRMFGARVLDLLEAARSDAERIVGRSLSRPLDVYVYTRGHYLRSYRHRFGFATVGFYDGAIHAVSGRTPERELRALLTHEYLHAVFREALRSHRPFFLNEGIADGAEERLRGYPRLSRSGWRSLVEALRDADWIPLSTLVAGFGGFEGERARLAYLESRAAVELLEARSPGVLARWLERCARAEPWERALEAESGWTTATLDLALQEDVESRFPADPLAHPLGE
ncbi:MAG: hypothetical protein ACE5IL_06685 [Myxococcota bacterium]